MREKFLKIEQNHVAKDGRKICRDFYLLKLSQILYVNWFQAENGDNECCFYFENPDQDPLILRDTVCEETWQNLIKLLEGTAEII